MLGSPAGPGGPAHRGLWPVAPPPIQSAANFAPDGFYSFLPGSPTFGSALYSHSSAIGRLATATIQPTPGAAFHPAHKVSESLFASSGYTFGAPTPPPGSPYSPVPVTHLDVLTKGFNSNIIIQQPEYPSTPKKLPDETAACCKKSCCSCVPTRSKHLNTPSGCSRTNPVNWNLVSIKKEPGATPCQVAEVTTSGSPNVHATIKVEVASPTQKTCVSNVCHDQVQHCGIGSLPTVVTSNGNIPVGIAVARQRKHQEVIASPSLSPMTAHAGHPGLLTTISAAQMKNVTRISDLDADMGATSGTAGVVGGGTLLQCPPEERGGGFAGWPVGGAHNSALATPTLWQYPAHLPMEPLLPMPMPPVGFQLVRDHNTGGLLLLPTTSVEQVQQVVWPSYHHPSSHVLLPPTLPPPPLQLLSSSSDYLQSSTTLHQQTHSARLLAVTTDKRKLPLPIPTTTFIKIESELNQNKVQQTVSSFDNNTGTVYTDPNMGPLVTTHVIYQHPPNLILSQNTAPAPEIHPTATCRSQATSPVTCLTPPPDFTPDEEASVQDASNQTEGPECEVQEELPPCKEEVQDHLVGKLSNSVPDLSIQERLVPNLPRVVTSEPAAVTPAIVHEAFTTKQEKMDEGEEDESNTLPHVQSNENSLVSTVKSLIPITNEQCTKPILDIKREKQSEGDVMSSSPDLSGLELLSNSIEEFENSQKIELDAVAPASVNIPCCTKSNDEVLERIAQMTLADKPGPAKDELAGLDLLCALAEQRIMEEVNSTVQHVRHVKRENTKCEKRKLEGDYELECETKPKQMNISDIQSDDKKRDNSIKSCTCKEDSYRTYKTKESEEEAKKFLASRSQASCCNNDWPCMNAMELDMRMRLADLQRKYREKQRELSKLRPKRHEHRERYRNKKKSRKKAIISDRNTPPPRLDKISTPVSHTNNNVCMELLKPPKLCAYGNQENNGLQQCLVRKMYGDDTEMDLSYKSSKKRKVGRPKKLMSSSGLQSGTETIVAKKLKKGNLVGYLLAAKEKLIQNNSVYSDPPRFVDDTYKPRNRHQRVITPTPTDDASHSHEEDTDIEVDVEVVEKEDKNLPECVDVDDFTNNKEDSEEEESPLTAEPAKDVPADTTTGTQSHNGKEIKVEEQEDVEPAPEIDCRCLLTTNHLEQPKLRVLTAMGGLFYAGRLNAVEPPDVYSITLDGERGNRPHIMSREEILRDAILEVPPTKTEELPPGTRLCAYWSQQYRCLYPGSVAEPEGSETDLKFVSVEFDDGDSGRIAIEDIRLLPVDYPIIEYDPNPLLSLSKKRRRTSTVEERRAPVVHKSPTPPPPPPPAIFPKESEIEPDTKLAKSNQDSINKDLQSYKERRRLKKKKRNKFKQKLHDERKKRKKHKYPEENSKHHKHHKKHHKHKKHHHKKSTHDNDTSSGKKNAAEEVEETEEYQTVVSEVDADVDEVIVDVEGGVDAPEIEECTDPVPNVEDEVTMDDILEAKAQKSKKFRDRQESCESRSKMSAFLPARQMWGWSGKGYKRPRTKGRSRKQFYRAIQRGKETIQVGDSAVFLSTGRPDRPYIGKIEAMWESCGTMVVKVKWFYHPEETIGCPQGLKYPGALFESPHVDENDVQTISHKCEVLPLLDYTNKLGDNPKRYATIYDNNDIYYLAGYYDPTSTTLKMESDIPYDKTNDD